MSLSSVIDVGVGLILVYYVVSTIIQGIANEVSRIRNLGAKKLADGLREMLTDPATLNKLQQHPLIANLAQKRMNIFGGVTVKGADFIPSQTFAVTLFDVLVPGEKGEDAQALAALREAAGALPPGTTRDALLTLLTSGVNTLEKAQERVAAWFDDSMESVSDLYTQHMRLIVWLVAAVVTLALGIDSIDIGLTLWQQPTIRAAAAAETTTMAQQGQLNLQSANDTRAALDKIEALRIPLFWNFTNLPATLPKWGLKLLGLIITWVAVAQGAPFWYDVLKKVKPS